VLVIGSPGGRTIINTVFQTVLAVLSYEMPIHEAIESLKIHHQWLPDEIRYEANKLPVDVRTNLEHKGHSLREVGALGRLMGIQVVWEKGFFVGYADSSSPDGGAAAY
jgi:gamma-glutamyltranspeptidase/glutathione hydrolase